MALTNKHFLTFEVKQKKLAINFDCEKFLTSQEQDLKRSKGDILTFVNDAMEFFKEKWDLDFTDLTTAKDFLYTKEGKPAAGKVSLRDGSASLQTHTFSREGDKDAPFRIVSEVDDNSCQFYGRHAATDVGLIVNIHKPFKTPKKGIELKEGWFVWTGNIDVRGLKDSNGDKHHIFFTYKSLIPIGSQRFTADNKTLTSEFFELYTDYMNLGKGRGMGTIYDLEDGSAVGEYVLNWDKKNV